MLSKNVLKLTAIRIRSMALLGQTICKWDSKTNQMIPASPYLRFNWWFCAIGCLQFAFYHTLRIYTSLTDEDKPEFDVGMFATLAIECTEIIVAMVISLLVFLILQRSDDIIFLFNQIWFVNNSMLDMMKARNIVMDYEQRKTMRSAEKIIFTTSFLTAAFPFALIAIIFHPLEPNNVMLREWLEFELVPEKFQMTHFIVLYIFIGGFYQAANAIYLFGSIVVCYCYLAIPCLSGMTPVSIHQTKESKRCGLATRKYGELKDEEIIHLYRIQQHLNNLMNNVVKSTLLSLHHVACLAATCVLAFFAIRFQPVLNDAGMLGYVVVLGGLCLPLIIEFLESAMIGELVDNSEKFKEAGVKLMPRKTLFYKFARSCQKMYVEEAYPFFKIRRETIFEFLSKAVDYTITLLLW